MKLFMESFDPRDFSSMKTMEQFKDHVNKQMKDPTFLKYIALRRQPRIGDVTAMKIIKDPNEPWDKSFVSPCLKHDDIRADIKDEATYWDSRTSARQQESAENTNAGAPPQQQPAAASSSRSERSASSSSQAPAAATAANESNGSTRVSTATSNSSSSAAATSNGSSNPYSSSTGGATASFPYFTNSARATKKPTGEKSQTKKRSAPKQTPYKKRQKPSEKVYVRQNPSHSKSSSSTPKESFTHNGNGYMTANPLHESRNSSLVAALLNDDESMNTKPKAKDVSVRRESSANLSCAKSAGAEKFNYMLEFDEDDIEGQVVAVPVTQNTKSDLEDEAPTRDDDQKKDTGSKYASKSSSWYDEYKDVLESSSDDDSVSSAEMGNKQDGATNKNDVIVIDDDDDDDDDGSVGSVIILD